MKSHVSTRSLGGFGYVDWPNTVEERPNLKNISGSTVTFVDGTSDDFDVIIKSTGNKLNTITKTVMVTIQQKNRRDSNKTVMKPGFKSDLVQRTIFFFN